MRTSTSSILVPGIAASLLLSIVPGCGSTLPENASHPLYAECAREARILSSDQHRATRNLMDGPDIGSAEQAIKDARSARTEATATGLAAWPEEALIARCLENNGVPLTPQQTDTLRKWQERAPAPE